MAVASLRFWLLDFYKNDLMAELVVKFLSIFPSF